jgi:tetratricopeptide (TPR) repeat protein
MKFLKPKYIVIVIPFLLYLSTCRNGYSFDDNFVVQNERVKQGFTAIPEIFTSYYHQEENNTFGYRPVVQSLFAIEYAVFGENPGVSHFISVLMYALLCLLIFNFIRALFPSLDEKFALIVVVLFAVHPVHTEVVASLKNREEIVAMLLGISALMLFVRFLEHNRVVWLIPLPFLFFLAVLSKENALTYPLILPIVYIAKMGWPGNDFRKYLLPVLLTSVFFVIAWLAWKTPGMILPPAAKELFSFENPLHTDHSYAVRLFITGITLWFYISVLLVPWPLRFYYGYNMFPDDNLHIVLAVLAFMIYAALILLAIRQIKAKRELSFFIFFYLISLSVFTNYFIPVNGITGERLVFQASLGFCGFLIAGLYWLWERKRTFKKVSSGILYVVIALFVVMTFQRTRDWKSMDSLLKADIGKLGNSAKGQVVYASYHMGKIMNQKAAGQYISPESVRKVIQHYRRSLEICPTYYSSANNAGTLYLHVLNMPDSALSCFNKALAVKPDYREALFNISGCLLGLNKRDSAKVILISLLEKHEMFADAWLRLADVYMAENEYENATHAAQRALQGDTVSDRPYISLGNILLLKKDTAGAVGMWEMAIDRNPANPSLLYGLSRYFQQTGNKTKAEKYAELFQRYNKK